MRYMNNIKIWIFGFVIIFGVLVWVLLSLTNTGLETKLESKSEVVHSSTRLPSSAQASKTIEDSGVTHAPQMIFSKNSVDEGVSADVGQKATSEASETSTIPKISFDEKRQKLRAIRDQLNAIATSDPQKRNPDDVIRLLGELNELSDNGVLAGVQIQKLADIVKQSNLIMAIAQGNNLLPGEDKNARLKEEVEKLRQLQSGLVVNQNVKAP
ncbi:MAG: hypothetical protein IE928_05595 [Gammaproteobacteria bacterium]|nr:hypothetical protein [Gammaproteobacteria bacterium]